MYKMMQTLMLCMVASTLISANSLRLNDGEMNNVGIPRTFLDLIKLYITKMNGLNLIYCPTGQVCASDNTCCKMKHGGYSCCPAPNAVCCADDIHCCRAGFTCTGVSCTRGDSFSFDRNMMNGLNSIYCPSGQVCASGNTCCKIKHDEYGCCPVPNAVCCNGGKHCCRNGYICNDPCTKINSFPFDRKMAIIMN